MVKERKRKNLSKAKSQSPCLYTAPEYFEDAFVQRLGQHPLEWVRMKLEGGSDVGSIRYLYGISANAIAHETSCVPVSFEHYCRQYLKAKKTATAPHETKKIYNKLVRDRIPEIIEASGKTCSYETLTDEKYLVMLDAKLNEELAEYQESKSLEELADLLEVLGAVVKARGHTWEELTAVRRKKRESRGGFEKRILLKEVSDAVGKQKGSTVAPQTKAAPINAGSLWTELEEDKLLDEYDSNMPIEAIAREHGRSTGAIESRLVQLGVIKKAKPEPNEKPR